MKAFILFTIVFASSAQAEVRKRHIDINLCPTLVFEGTEQTITFRGWKGIIPTPEQPDEHTVVQSDWDYLTCEIEGSSLTIVTTIPEESYPLTQVPDTATCTAQDSIGNVHILYVHPVLREASDMACWERANAWYAYESTLIYSSPDHDGLTVLPLLSGHSFVNGTYQAKLDDGSDWIGVSCEVQDNGTYMAVTNKLTTLEGSGYCPILDVTDQGTLTAIVKVELLRI
ncbi:hypothetical protein HN358_02480 [Candidatus Uhrbacteria bacterium]|nr:hypothetical protein [Candidatus Uhrbacteria bacterium]MBT7717546.1 hypothetical protein [Candidatus Uhrbacteria bacterium]